MPTMFQRGHGEARLRPLRSLRAVYRLWLDRQRNRTEEETVKVTIEDMRTAPICHWCNDIRNSFHLGEVRVFYTHDEKVMCYPCLDDFRRNGQVERSHMGGLSMASKRQELRAASCLGKKTFRSETEARGRASWRSGRMKLSCTFARMKKLTDESYASLQEAAGHEQAVMAGAGQRARRVRGS